MYNRVRMNSSRHTRQRFCLALIVSLLFCGLTAIEVPEFVRLVDDTSNDYTLLASVPASDSLDVREAADSVTGAIQKEIDERAACEERNSAALRPSHAPSGYLQRICILRT